MSTSVHLFCYRQWTKPFEVAKLSDFGQVPIKDNFQAAIYDLEVDSPEFKDATRLTDQTPRTRV